MPANNAARLAPILVLLAVSGAAAEPSPAGLPLPLYCYGGEPFWSLTIHDAKSATFKNDLEQSVWKIERVNNAAQRPTTWRVSFKGRQRHALIFDEGKACSDSDGERPLAYGLLLEDDAGLLRGCCDPEP